MSTVSFSSVWSCPGPRFPPDFGHFLITIVIYPVLECQHVLKMSIGKMSIDIYRKMSNAPSIAVKKENHFSQRGLCRSTAPSFSADMLQHPTFYLGLQAMNKGPEHVVLPAWTPEMEIRKLIKFDLIMLLLPQDGEGYGFLRYGFLML